MQTTEQQIETYRRVSDNKPTSYDESLIRSMIREAENKGEQRGREEAGQDSQRLDFLEREFILMALVKGPAPVDPDKKLDAVFTQTGGIPFRQAIDAARREAGKGEVGGIAAST